MKQKYQGIELDNKTKEQLNAKMVMNLFEILYIQNKITKKEYDSLILNVCRTFNIEKQKC